MKRKREEGGTLRFRRSAVRSNNRNNTNLGRETKSGMERRLPRKKIIKCVLKVNDKDKYGCVHLETDTKTNIFVKPNEF